MNRPAGKGLTHVGPEGAARMVDVGGKPETERIAVVTGQISMDEATLGAIVANTLAKGDVLGVARLAGIMAAKKTADLIPLCHPISLTDIQVTLEPDALLPGIRVEAVAKAVGRTGVEMEALTAASISLMTVYDMAKAIDRGMTIGELKLQLKTGGAGGSYTRG